MKKTVETNNYLPESSAIKKRLYSYDICLKLHSCDVVFVHGCITRELHSIPLFQRRITLMNIYIYIYAHREAGKTIRLFNVTHKY